MSPVLSGCHWRVASAAMGGTLKMPVALIKRELTKHKHDFRTQKNNSQ